MSNRAYKRSWKNLLINKQYQLRFTLVMVGLATLLMAALGWWVVRVASEATTVSKSGIRGQACPGVPELVTAAPEPEVGKAPAVAPAAAGAGEGAAAGADPGTGSGSGSGSGSGTGSGSGSGSGSAAGSGAGSGTGVDVAPADEVAPADGEHHRRVVIESSSMTIEEPPPPPPVTTTVPENYAQLVAAHHACELGIAAALDRADRRFRMIVAVMVVAGLALILALAVMGIKMTHKVAGPLYKVSLYLAKVKDGRYDKVYDLRKGDQLVEFYEHFKHAHAGVVRVEQEDVAQIAAALEAAKAAAARDPAVEAAAKALAEVRARKETSLGG